MLRPGSRGPMVEFLQLGLTRAAFGPLEADGIYGQRTTASVMRFQSANNLTVDGVTGVATWRALRPYLYGYATHRIRPGDTIYRISEMHGTTVRAIETANPGLDPFNLRIGTRITVPLGFNVVPENIGFTSVVLECCVEGLKARYPFLKTGSAGKSVMGKDLYYLSMGRGGTEVFYNASHHANEWITTPLLMKFLENYCISYALGRELFSTSAQTMYESATLYIAPMVDPDGVDLVTGLLDSGRYYERAKTLSLGYPSIPFPDGWKANIDGIDLNLQYPAGWENAHNIKFAQGFTKPGPRDYVGPGALAAPESRAIYLFTMQHDFALTISYHTQGEVIFWKYLDYMPPRSREIADKFAELSEYAVEDTPYESGYAGYKDWFIYKYLRPGYTIEAGRGASPLPISDLGRIYDENVGILTYGLTALSRKS